MMTKDELIAFENKIRDMFNNGQLPYLIHFSGGNEDQLIEIFKNINKNDWVFSTHRSHYHYLLHKNDPDKLLEMIKSGESMHIFDDKFYTSSIVSGCCTIAVGVAKAIKDIGSTYKVWCFVGDGAEDEGHFYEAVRYADGWNLPCTFIIEDNDLSVDTPKWDRSRGSMNYMSPKIIRYCYTRKYPHVQTGKFVKEYL